MNDSIWQAIANIPWWIYATFIYLIRLGLLASKPRVVPIQNLFILPSFFVLLSLVCIYTSKELSFFTLSIWLSTLLLGALLGWFQFRMFKIKAIKEEAKLYLPGTWSLLILILISIALKFYFINSANTFDAHVLTQPKFAGWLFSLYGFFTGLFLGRFFYSWRCLKVGPFA